jgi:hypothetical protein
MQHDAATQRWQTAVGTGVTRIGAGVVLLRWRSTLIKLCGGSPDDPVLRAVFGYFGVRDIALGTAALLATRPDADVPRQVAVQGVADAVDTAVLSGLVATGHLTRVQGSGAAALAGATAVANFATSWKLRRIS